MVSIYDVDPSKLVEKLAEELKKVEHVLAPEWAQFVKTGSGKERPPIKKDWWHFRAASVMRKVYVSGPIGVSKLRKKYSSKKNRGHKPERVYPGSGNILRKVLQQLEKAELLKYVEKGVHKGRVVTGKGEKLLNQVAKGLVSSPKETFEKKPSPREEVKTEVKENGSGKDKGTEDKGTTS
ncbi:MAG: 30S ribosomal protein S19e [Nanoarchaeota archaeon]|nr:30S ribosomal protein S19e [Nanoarchaeota archaeon]|tara:strand:+ start:133 stop:672 length:540 start_codon:yes stop_codon:yes gene_type:complete